MTQTSIDPPNSVIVACPQSHPLKNPESSTSRGTFPDEDGQLWQIYVLPHSPAEPPEQCDVMPLPWPVLQTVSLHFQPGSLIEQLRQKPFPLKLLGARHWQDAAFHLSEVIMPPDPDDEAAPVTVASPIPLQAVNVRPKRATWLWAEMTALDDPEKTLFTLLKYDIRRLNLTVKIDPKTRLPRYTEKLARFIAMAHHNQIQVWAVMGDPAMIDPHNLDWVLQPLAALERYNQLPEYQNAKIDGVQLDVEPHTLPGFSAHQSVYFRQLVELYQKTRQASRLPIDAVVPYWYSAKSIQPGTSVIDALLPWVSSLTIMNYVTDPVALEQRMQPIFNAADKARKPVNMAVEFLPVPDETMWTFQPSSVGQVHLLPFKHKTLLLISRDPHPVIHPSGVCYSLGSPQGQLYSGQRISFHGQTDRFWQVLPDLERNFSAWNSYSGISIHDFTQL
jgi:hypothetical protein